MKFNVDMIVLCEVSVDGVVEADSMEEAIAKALEIGTNSGEGFDHEIISDIKTLAIKVKEVQL